MANVRILVCNWGNAKEKKMVETFSYRGYYCKKGGHMAFHSYRRLANRTIINNCPDTDVFEIAHGEFDTPESFKEIVDEHIDYIQTSFGSFEKYVSLNS